MNPAEKNRKVDEITMLELIQVVLRRWKLIVFSCITVALLNYLYLSFLSPKNYIAEGTLIVNMEHNEFSSYFGNYALLSTQFEDYMQMLHDEKLISKTIDDLGLEEFSVQNFRSALSCSSKNQEDQKGFDISFKSYLKNPATILNKHIKNFIDYLNFQQYPIILAYFENQKKLNRTRTIQSIELMNERILFTDSLLQTIKKYNTSSKENSNLKQSNILLTAKEIFNENFIELENKKINFHSKLFEYEKNLLEYNHHLDSLAKLKNQIPNSLEEYNGIFNFFEQTILPLTPNSEPTFPISNNAIKRSIYAAGIVFFILTFFFTFLAMIRKEKQYV